MVGDSTQAVASQGVLNADLFGLAPPAREIEVTRLQMAGFPLRAVQADGRREHSPVQAGSSEEPPQSMHYGKAISDKKKASPST